MHVMTSQYVISGKITFAQLKLNPPGHNLSARHNKQHFAQGKSWHFHTALRELHQTSPSASRTVTFFFSSIMTGMNNHTDDSYLSQKERAIPLLCWFSFSEWAQWSLDIKSVLSCFFIFRENLGHASKACYQSTLISRASFSANGISLCLGEVQMKIYERSLQALLSSATAHSCLSCLGGLLRLPKWRACSHAISFVSQALFLCWLIHVIVTKTIAICRLLHTSSIRS